MPQERPETPLESAQRPPETTPKTAKHRRTPKLTKAPWLLAFRLCVLILLAKIAFFGMPIQGSSRAVPVASEAGGIKVDWPRFVPTQVGNRVWITGDVGIDGTVEVEGYVGIDGEVDVDWPPTGVPIRGY